MVRLSDGQCSYPSGKGGPVKVIDQEGAMYAQHVVAIDQLAYNIEYPRRETIFILSEDLWANQVPCRKGDHASEDWDKEFREIASAEWTQQQYSVQRHPEAIHSEQYFNTHYSSRYGVT